MQTLVRPIIAFTFLLLFRLSASACIDSVWYKVKPVQCFSLRNGEILVDKVFGGLAPYYYSIDGQSFSTNPNFDHLWTGDYTLSIRDASGCVTTILLNIPEPPELIVRLQANDSSIVAGKPLVLSALVSPETADLGSILWRPPYLFSNQDTLSQRLIISETTNFAVEIIDENGCSARSNLTVAVEQTNIYIPNALRLGSPQDAFFTVFAGDGVKKVAFLRVYSRSGSMIFERLDFPPNDPLKGWNGRWKSQKVQPGVYLWLANVELLDGTVERFEGTVTVVE